MPAETVLIQRGEVRLIESYYECLGSVAREKIFIEMIEAPPLEKTRKFQESSIVSGAPVAYAVAGDNVVGWSDIFVSENPRCAHRGNLGMGLHKDFRGQGLGAKLLEHVLTQARDFGLEKVELYVYSTNTAARALYKKFGFEEEGSIRRYRKLDGYYFDCVAMGKFL